MQDKNRCKTKTVRLSLDRYKITATILLGRQKTAEPSKKMIRPEKTIMEIYAKYTFTSCSLKYSMYWEGAFPLVITLGILSRLHKWVNARLLNLDSLSSM